MKICYLSNYFPPESNSGTELYTLGVAGQMRQRGHEPFVFTVGKWAEGDRHFNGFRDDSHQGIPVRRLDFNWKLAHDPFVALYDNPLVEQKLKVYLAERQPDIVHITSLYTLTASAVRAVKSLGLPVIMSLHDFWMICPKLSLLHSNGYQCDGHVPARECLKCMSQEAKIYRWPRKILPKDTVIGGLEKLARFHHINRIRGLIGMVGDYQARRAVLRAAVNQIDLFLLPSRFLHTVFASHEVPAEKLRVLEEGIDTSWWTGTIQKTTSDHLRIGYIGQVLPKKGVHVLLEGFNHLHGPATLTIYGDHKKDSLYEKFLTSLTNGNGQVKFAGGFDHANLESILAEIDVLVVPSLWDETFCIVVREGLQAGVPVIGSNVGGIPDAIVPEKNGFLFQPGDVNALAGILQKLLDHPGLLEELKNGSKGVKDIRQEALEMERVYDELISVKSL